MKLILGPCPCQGCGALVWWGRALTRLAGEVVMGGLWWREWGAYRTHRCRPVRVEKVRRVA